MKSNAEFKVLKTIKATGAGVLEDTLIQLSSTLARQICPQKMRRIRFVREEDGKELTFIKNDLIRSAEEIADLYKRRWQIELFFKWIKQNLKIKRFLRVFRRSLVLLYVKANLICWKKSTKD